MCAHSYVAVFDRRHAALALVEPAYLLDDVGYIRRVAVLVQGPVATLHAMNPWWGMGSTGILEHSAPFNFCRMTLTELFSVLANIFTMIPWSS